MPNLWASKGSTHRFLNALVTSVLLRYMSPSIFRISATISSTDGNFKLNFMPSKFLLTAPFNDAPYAYKRFRITLFLSESLGRVRRGEQWECLVLIALTGPRMAPLAFSFVRYSVTCLGYCRAEKWFVTVLLVIPSGFALDTGKPNLRY